MPRAFRTTPNDTRDPNPSGSYIGDPGDANRRQLKAAYPEALGLTVARCDDSLVGDNANISQSRKKTSREPEPEAQRT